MKKSLPPSQRILRTTLMLCLLFLFSCKREHIETTQEAAKAKIVPPTVYNGKLSFENYESYDAYVKQLEKLSPQQMVERARQLGYVSFAQKYDELTAAAAKAAKNDNGTRMQSSGSQTQMVALPFVSSRLFASLINDKAEFRLAGRIGRITNEYTLSYIEEDSAKLKDLTLAQLDAAAAGNEGKFFDVPGTRIKAFKVHWQRGEQTATNVKPSKGEAVANSVGNPWEEWTNPSGVNVWYTFGTAIRCNGSRECPRNDHGGLRQTEGGVYNWNNGLFSTIDVYVKNTRLVELPWATYYEQEFADYIGARWKMVLDFPTPSGYQRRTISSDGMPFFPFTFTVGDLYQLVTPTIWRKQFVKHNGDGWFSAVNNTGTHQNPAGHLILVKSLVNLSSSGGGWWTGDCTGADLCSADIVHGHVELEAIRPN